MLKEILSITGKPGLFKIVSHNGRSLIVEDIKTKKRFPVSAREKVISLGDVAMYTTGDDLPLPEIFERCYKVNEGKTVDLKALVSAGTLPEAFEAVVPDFDRDRVYTSDIRKMFMWYNTLVEAGFTQFVESEESAEAEKEEPEAKEETK